MIRTVIFALAIARFAACADPAHSPLVLAAPIQDKNFYLLSLIERTPGVRQAMEQDRELASTHAAKVNQLHSAVRDCGAQAACYALAMKLNADDMGQPRDALKRLYKENAAVRQMVDGPLRASGAYVRYHDRTGEELLAQAWVDAARGINNAIDVYAVGKAPRYPEIDGATVDVKAESFGRVLAFLTQVMDDDRGNLPVFFTPSLHFALSLMDANQRDEAGRFEPLEQSENAAAVKRIRAMTASDWARFAYSAIVVPGSGTDRINVTFSPMGKLRTQLAAKRYKEGKAPFVIVSGGYVHPNQTPWCEALEMKKALMKEYGVPESAILIDPHARHTTTNRRNANREIYRYGMPFEKPALITTDPGQSSSIESPAFRARCSTELGYRPYAGLKRISAFDLEFLPTIESLQIDAMDPLDP